MLKTFTGTCLKCGKEFTRESRVPVIFCSFKCCQNYHSTNRYWAKKGKSVPKKTEDVEAELIEREIDNELEELDRFEAELNSTEVPLSEYKGANE